MVEAIDDGLSAPKRVAFGLQYVCPLCFGPKRRTDLGSWTLFGDLRGWGTGVHVPGAGYPPGALHRSVRRYLCDFRRRSGLGLLPSPAPRSEIILRLAAEFYDQLSAIGVHQFSSARQLARPF